MYRTLRPFTLVILAIALAFTACDDDDDPTGLGADTTAPLVLSITPSPDDTGVGLDDDIVVLFNEDMDPNSATGQVTLTAGTLGSLSWDNPRALRIDHTAWSEGTRVDVTLGVGIADVAGNGLSAPYTSGFWTQSSLVILLSSTPTNGATNVSRNAPVSLLFSRRMNLTTLEAATTVDDGTLQRAPLDFTMSEGDGDHVILSFPTPLPALATISVDITTAATTVEGANLAQAVSFSFTTGSTLDTTPPTLVSITPADGAVIVASTSAIVMTFSEAIDADRFEPSSIGAQFALLLEGLGVEPSWSANGTVLTVPLPTPLPTGLPIQVSFDTFYDLAGNGSAQGIEYRVDVAGTPDPWPFTEGVVHAYVTVEGEEGQIPNFGEAYDRMERETPGDVMRRARYRDEALTDFDGWERFRRTGTQIAFLGFRELDEGVPTDVPFDPAVLYLKLPFQVQSWSGSTEATLSESGVATIDYTVSVLGQEDLPTVVTEILRSRRTSRAAPFESRVWWVDCWKTVLEYELSSDDVTFTAGADTIWYAPTIGVVKLVGREEDFEDSSIYVTEEDLVSVRFPD